MANENEAKSPRHMVFQWHITDNCDQRCKHCYIFGEDPSIALYSTPFIKMKEVVDRCIAYTARFDARPVFAITGGDPLLNPEFWKLAEYLKAQGIKFHITKQESTVQSWLQYRT